MFGDGFCVSWGRTNVPKGKRAAIIVYLFFRTNFNFHSGSWQVSLRSLFVCLSLLLINIYNVSAVGKQVREVEQEEEEVEWTQRVGMKF